MTNSINATKKPTVTTTAKKPAVKKASTKVVKKVSLEKKPVTEKKANLDTAKKTPLAVPELSFKGFKLASDILALERNDTLKALRFDSRFSKGWDTSLKAIFFKLNDIKTGKEFANFMADSKNRFIVHYVGLLSFYKENGIKSISLKNDTKDVTILTNHFSFVTDADYVNGLDKWNLLTEAKNLAHSKNGFKFQHLVRLHIVLLKMECSLNK